MHKVITWALLGLMISGATASHGMDYIPKVFKTRSFVALLGAATAFSATVYAVNYWQDAPNRALCQAVLDGDAASVKQLLNQDADYTRTARNGKNLLHYAVCKGHHEIAWMLAHTYELINAEDVDGHTPLYYAVQNNDKKMFALLRKAGANRFCAREMTQELEAAITALES